MNKFPAVSTLQLVSASVLLMTVLLGVKSTDMVGELLLPSARAEAPQTASQTAPQTAPQTASAATMDSDPPILAAAPAPAPISDEERQLLQDLRARKQDLDSRENALAIREAALAAATKRLSDRVQELKDLQDSLQKLQDASTQKDDQNWKGLVAVYETMKPASAAAILDSLEMPVLLQIFDRMSDRKAALILSDMDPDRARLVTVELAKMRESRNSTTASNS